MIGALLRVSTDQQETEMQVAEINAYCKDKGLSVDRWFKDKLSRDNAANRTEFQEMLRLVERGLLKVVLIQKLDRFGISDSDEWAHYRWVFRKSGAKIISVAEGDLTATDAATKITTGLKADASAEEQRNISHRGLNGRAMKAEKGEWVGGPAPFGYDKVCLDAEGRLVWRLVKLTPVEHIQILPYGTERQLHGRQNTPRKTNKHDRLTLLVNEEQAELVRSIFRLWTESRVSLLGIATRLNRQGKRIHGKPFKQATIKRILRNRRYLGHSIWNEVQMGRFKEYRDGRPVPIPDEVRQAKTRGKKKRYILRRNTDDQLIVKRDAWPAILVREDVFKYAQEKLRQVKDSKGRTPRNATFWLKGLLICKGCGQPMQGEIHKGKAWYCCRTFINADKAGLGDQCTCSRNTIAAVDVEARLYAWLEERQQAISRVSDFADAESIMDAIRKDVVAFEAQAFDLQGWERYYSRLWADFGLDDPQSNDAREMVEIIQSLRIEFDDEVFTILDAVKIAEAKRQESALKAQLADIIKRKAVSRSELEEEVWIAEQDKTEGRILRMRKLQVPYNQRLREARSKFRELEERLTAFNPKTLADEQRAEGIRRLVNSITLDIQPVPNLTGLVHQAMADVGDKAPSRVIKAWLNARGIDMETKTIATLRKQRGSNRKRYVLARFHVESIFSEATKGQEDTARQQSSAIGAFN